jgi:hypothetical protein
MPISSSWRIDSPRRASPVAQALMLGRNGPAQPSPAIWMRASLLDALGASRGAFRRSLWWPNTRVRAIDPSAVSAAEVAGRSGTTVMGGCGDATGAGGADLLPCRTQRPQAAAAPGRRDIDQACRVSADEVPAVNGLRGRRAPRAALRSPVPRSPPRSRKRPEKKSSRDTRGLGDSSAVWGAGAYSSRARC